MIKSDEKATREKSCNIVSSAFLKEINLSFSVPSQNPDSNFWLQILNCADNTHSVAFRRFHQVENFRLESNFLASLKKTSHLKWHISFVSRLSFNLYKFAIVAQIYFSAKFILVAHIKFLSFHYILSAAAKDEDGDFSLSFMYLCL